MAGFLSKYHLQSGSKKWPCPGCGQRTFTPYVDAQTKEPVNPDLFGRCDRRNHCTYHVLPDAKPEPVTGTYITIQIYPDEKVLKSLTRSITPLHKYLWDQLQITSEQLWDIGVLADGDLTAFVHRDVDGKLCNVKWMKYKDDGHRTKFTRVINGENVEFGSISLPQPKKRNQYIEEKYGLSLFLEHLLDPEKKKTVCVVESEKTAAICHFIYPQFDWVACAANTGLSDGSNGTSNKIKALKGRKVYWIRDADASSRPVQKEDQDGRPIMVPVSSERNLEKHIEDWHIVDLWPQRDDGYDVGDAVLEGKKPDIKPTWSKKPPDPRELAYVPPDMDVMLYEFDNGKEIGEPANIPAMGDIFSWMRGFMNCWTGWPNDGKSTFFLFMAVIKSVMDGWKWCIWPPEMISSTRDPHTRAIRISARDIYDEIVFMLTGKCPYKHWVKKYGVAQIDRDEYIQAVTWVKRHFFVVYPQSRKPEDLFSVFKYQHELNGIDGFLIDPFKNLKHDEGGRTDQYLDEIFTMIKATSLETNSSFNIIAHPKSQAEPKNSKGAYKVCTPHMLSGGAAWHNNMDGIFSIYRPLRHQDIRDTTVHFFNLKQRKQELVGTVGQFEDINFDFFGHRFYFKGVCPIDGTLMPVRDRKANGALPAMDFGQRHQIIQTPIQFQTTVLHDYSQPTFDPKDDETPF